MICIFAKKGTAEKVAIFCADAEARKAVLLMLNAFSLGEKGIGDWAFVDSLMTGEGLVFTDTQIYRGFESSVDRYTDAIIRVLI